MANLTHRVRTLGTRIENSNTKFSKEILNNTVHLIPLDKGAMKNHARVQLQGLKAQLDQRKINNSVADTLGALIYNTALKALTQFSSPSVAVARLGSSPIDKKLLAAGGTQFSGSTVVFRARAASVGNINLRNILTNSILPPVHNKILAFLRPFTRQGITLTESSLLRLEPMFSSSSTFNATIRELIKSAQRLPKENRTQYLADIKRYANDSIKTVNSKYSNSDWSLQVKGTSEVSIRKLSSAATVTLALTAPVDVKASQMAAVEREALKALLQSGQKSFEKFLLQDSEVIPRVEKMLVNAALTSLTKKKLNVNKKKRYVSKKEMLAGITNTKSINSRSAVWRVEGRETLAEVTKNLLAIKNIVNEFLPAYMERNMGKGNAKTILNYRTGRLADSAALDFIHPIRNNLIQAKVDYMRDPYKTFSAKGDKSEPRTRDPKRLVDKSIRQILKEKLQIAMAFKSELS